MPAAMTNLPDVLGMITGGARATADVVSYAFAVHPLAITVGQAVEGLILLQNNCDKPITATVQLRLPRKDMAGRPMSLIVPREKLDVPLQPGETGLLHLPIAAMPPTQPSEGTILGVRVEAKPPRGYGWVRPPAGGRPASILSMSPFRLSILRGVGFTAHEEGGFITRIVDIVEGQINAPAPVLAHRYETLWSARELPQEQARHTQLSEKATQFAGTISHSQILLPLIKQTEKVFSDSGLPLHPGEAVFIGKILAYTLEDGLEVQGICRVGESAWFQHLVGLIEDPLVTKQPDVLVEKIYMPLIRDGVRLGLKLVETVTGESLGSADDHRSYAQEVVSVLGRGDGIDLSHAYLPLVLAGVILNYDMRLTSENLWGNITALREAWRGRIKIIGSEFEWVAQVLSNLLHEAEQLLLHHKIPKR
ncbi:MAG: hypothetical protein HS103_08195 [Anaerolineales bacterium]|nr:hypothetical protein [Anaerolineales bacterium]